MESLYRGHRFPPEIISHAVWLYHRFTLSFRDVEDLLAERGIIVSYEGIRYWCLKFGLANARNLRLKQGRLGDIWYVDELFITRQQERQMRLFKSIVQAQRFLSVNGSIQNLFRVGRHHLNAANHRLLRARAFSDWREVTCVC